MAADATDPNKKHSRIEMIPSGRDRLNSALSPFFRYINILIEGEVFG